MKKLFTLKKHWLYLVFAIGIIIGVILIRAGLKHPVTVIVDDIPFSVETNALKAVSYTHLRAHET